MKIDDCVVCSRFSFIIILFFCECDVNDEIEHILQLL